MNKMITKMLVVCLLSMTQFAYGQDCGEVNAGPSEFNPSGSGSFDWFNK